MRNRQMIVNWLRAHTSAVEVRRRDGNTYFVMVDAAAFREGVGRLLAEVQRIKGEGDATAARDLFETYGVHFDPSLRDEIVARVDRLQLPSYTGFVMPRLEARRDDRGAIVDVEISYPCDLETQMLEYSAFARRDDLGRAGQTAERRGRVRCSRIVSRRTLRSTRSAARSRRSAAAGVPIVDLTESNPTTVGFGYPGDLFDVLSAEHVRRYAPQPLGLGSAREAVAADYARRGRRVDPAQVVLSASSSEAYSWLFKLLCNPGEACWCRSQAIRSSSTSRASRRCRRFPTTCDTTDDGRSTSIPSSRRPHTCERCSWCRRITRPARIVTRDEAHAAGRDLPIARMGDRGRRSVCGLSTRRRRSAPTESVMNLDVLSFTLGGASKSLGLPQIKLGWMVVGGPHAERARALAALEIIADTFLSVGTSVQGAAPSLLARGAVVRDQIRQSRGRQPGARPGRWRVSTPPARSCRSRAGGPS